MNVSKKEYKNIFNSNATNHAFIISISNDIDRLKLAKYIAKLFYCIDGLVKTPCEHCIFCKKIENDNHLDVHFIMATKEGKSKVRSLKDEAIEEMQQKVYLSPLEGRRKLFFILDAELMTLRAFNRLLKTLEEPPNCTTIILFTTNYMKLPDTVKSRCVHIFSDFRETEDNRYGVSKEDILGDIDIDDYLRALNNKIFYRASDFIENNSKDRDSAIIFLDKLEFYFLEKMRHSSLENIEKFARNIEVIEEARADLSYNANFLYTLKKVTLKIFEGEV